MPLDKNVILISEPKGDGDYVLLISRPGGGIMSAAQAAFFIDGLNVDRDEKGQPYQAIGTQRGIEVIRFPWGVPFILLHRNLVSFIDSVEAAMHQKEEEKAIEAVWKKDQGSEQAPPTGQYV